MFGMIVRSISWDDSDATRKEGTIVITRCSYVDEEGNHWQF